MRLRLTLACLFFSAQASAFGVDGWYDPAFLESQGQVGGSGFIHVPSAEVLPDGVLAAGIHRYNAKASRGFFGVLEAGLGVELEGWKLNDAEKVNLFNFRLSILKRERHKVSLALGADGIGPEDLGLKSLGYVARPEFEAQDRLYAVASALVPGLPMALLTLGWGGGSQASHPFGCLSVSPLDGLLVLAEYDGVGTNLGSRLFLSSQIKLDVTFNHTQSVYGDQPFSRVLQENIRFGVSYTEVWP